MLKFCYIFFSGIWQKIVQSAKDAGELGTSLHLSCQRHNNPAIIEKPQDFKDKVPAGISPQTNLNMMVLFMHYKQ